jgi:FKBP-type peptidyl-prolyl cis-trans isomerase
MKTFSLIVVAVVIVGIVAVVICKYNVTLCKDSGMGCGSCCCSHQPNNEEKEVVTKSGLRHTVLRQAADGARQAKAGDVVKVHYTGWLSEGGQKGAQFDSSIKRGTPFTFELGAQQVIAGWDEGVALMRVGEKKRFIIPANLGYGEQGYPGVIPQNATLIFEVELLEVIPA